MDRVLHISAGMKWCGLPTTKRHVIIIDFESDGGDYFTDWPRMSKRMGISPYQQNVDHYLFNYNGGEVDPDGAKKTKDLISICAQNPESHTSRFKWLSDKLKVNPDSLIIIDPLDTLFPMEKNKGLKVGQLLSRFRGLSHSFPKAAYILVFNLRKSKDHQKMPDLFRNPRSWLQETSGSLDIQNRSDLRLGLDEWEAREGLLVLNGLRRGKKIEPTVLEATWFPGDEPPKEVETGFQIVDLGAQDIENIFTPAMLEAWEKVGDDFTMEELLQAGSKGTMYRLVERAGAFGLLNEVKKGNFIKVTR